MKRKGLSILAAIIMLLGNFASGSNQGECHDFYVYCDGGASSGGTPTHLVMACGDDIDQIVDMYNTWIIILCFGGQ